MSLLGLCAVGVTHHHVPGSHPAPSAPLPGSLAGSCGISPTSAQGLLFPEAPGRSGQTLNLPSPCGSLGRGRKMGLEAWAGLGTPRGTRDLPGSSWVEAPRLGDGWASLEGTYQGATGGWGGRVGPSREAGVGRRPRTTTLSCVVSLSPLTQGWHLTSPCSPVSRPGFGGPLRVPHLRAALKLTTFAPFLWPQGRSAPPPPPLMSWRAPCGSGG